MCDDSATTPLARGAPKMTQPEPGVVLAKLDFPYPDKLISLNDRDHWSTKAKRTAAWRQAAFIHGSNLKRTARLPVPFDSVTVTCWFYGARQKDPSNLMPSVKAVVDGLTSAGWWDDDDADHVSQHEPMIVRPGYPIVTGGLCSVVVTAR